MLLRECESGSIISPLLRDIVVVADLSCVVVVVVVEASGSKASIETLLFHTAGTKVSVRIVFLTATSDCGGGDDDGGGCGGFGGAGCGCV